MIFTESVRAATSLANQGDFLSSIELLGERWRGFGVEPVRGRESDLQYARLLLVCGILTVRAGHFGARHQAAAKDLLSKSCRLFGDHPGRYEALLWLATAYVFCGEYSESLSLVESILADKAADLDVEFSTNVLRGYAYLQMGDVDMAEGSFTSVAVFLDAVSPISKGKFYLTRGMLLRQTNRPHEALADYELAFRSFAIANSLRYQAAAKNNAAGVLVDLGRFAEARSAAKVALLVFSQIQDRAHEAKAWDQLARIYEQEENYVEMARCADQAVDILSGGDHDGWLAEALITQGTARARLGMAQAKSALREALSICQRLDDPRQAEAATKQMWEIVRRGRETREALRRCVFPFERDVYERLLDKHRGRISPAAHELGLHHNVLQKRLLSHFPDLLAKRIPPIRRHKSLFKIR